MGTRPEWPGKPRICHHSKVLESGGTCASNTLETENQEGDPR